MNKQSVITLIRQRLMLPDQVIIAHAPELSDNAASLDECDTEGLRAVAAGLEAV